MIANWVEQFLLRPWLVDGWCVFCDADRGEHGDSGDWPPLRLQREGPLADPDNHEPACVWRMGREYVASIKATA